ncbi:MAG: hypothetical protein H6832_10245 [Planctomycetes bacterium]|nr:hypothetical protein [Planctomycetota bacterium]MCB9918769.1 hypothetical protein [Planctomycetota bacterium]
MNPEARRLLRELAARRGKEYGKLVQKLLALALLDAGATEVYERSTQGIDLEFRRDSKRFAVEVKTCEGRKLRLAAKDLAGLESRANAGITTYLAVLGPGLLDDLRLARIAPGELVASKDIILVELRAYRDAELEAWIRPAFERVIHRHTQRATTDGQSGLDAILSQAPEYRHA